jgi:hypothetical protein
MSTMISSQERDDKAGTEPKNSDAESNRNKRDAKAKVALDARFSTVKIDRCSDEPASASGSDPSRLVSLIGSEGTLLSSTLSRAKLTSLC